MIFRMTEKRVENNERLRQLVEQAQLTQAAALKIFNRGLGAAGYSLSAWKAFLAQPDSVRFRPLSDELLRHAERVFAKVRPEGHDKPAPH